MHVFKMFFDKSEKKRVFCFFLFLICKVMFLTFMIRVHCTQACAHRYKMVSSSFRWGLGTCLSMSNSLDEEDVWSPCEGRSKSGGHNEYGFCQAGISSSVNKVGKHSL